MTPSPVLRADSKFFGSPPHLCVDVRFRSTAEIDALIQALTTLRDMPVNGFDHIHLQDDRQKAAVSSAEITFWHPSASRDETDKRLVSRAGKFIRRQAR